MLDADARLTGGGGRDIARPRDSPKNRWDERQGTAGAIRTVTTSRDRRAAPCRDGHAPADETPSLPVAASEAQSRPGDHFVEDRFGIFAEQDPHAFENQELARGEKPIERLTRIPL
jgi:hypothetical protein